MTTSLKWIEKYFAKVIFELDVYEEAERSTKRQRIDRFSDGRFGQRNIMKMNDIAICNPHGSPPSNISNLEDVTYTSGLEMKEHLRISMVDTQVCV